MTQKLKNLRAETWIDPWVGNYPGENGNPSVFLPEEFQQATEIRQKKHSSWGRKQSD